MSNEIPGNVGSLVYTNLAPITSAVGVPPTNLGVGMRPHTVVPLIEGHVFSARGQGTWNLDRPISPSDVRFTRGSRLNGVKGTLDVWLSLGADGTARTICYLTDNPEEPTNVIAIRSDTSNRPFLSLTQGVIEPVPAGGILDMSGGNATNTETVTIGGKVYTFEAVLTNVNGHVKIGSSTAGTIENLIAAINLGPGAGLKYAMATTLHPTVRAEVGPLPSSVGIEAKQVGTVGNVITTTETLLNGFWVNGATMVDGSDGNLTTVAEITPSGPNYAEGKPVHLRMTWDTTAWIPGSIRYASFSFNEEPIAAGDWSTNPTTAWSPWRPTHLVLGRGLEALYLETGYNGVIQAVQLSNLVLP